MPTSRRKLNFFFLNFPQNLILEVKQGYFLKSIRVVYTFKLDRPNCVPPCIRNQQTGDADDRN